MGSGVLGRGLGDIVYYNCCCVVFYVCGIGVWGWVFDIALCVLMCRVWGYAVGSGGLGVWGVVWGRGCSYVACCFVCLICWVLGDCF